MKEGERAKRERVCLWWWSLAGKCAERGKFDVQEIGFWGTAAALPGGRRAGGSWELRVPSRQGNLAGFLHRGQSLGVCADTAQDSHLTRSGCTGRAEPQRHCWAGCGIPGEVVEEPPKTATNSREAGVGLTEGSRRFFFFLLLRVPRQVQRSSKE